jgi:polyhydroxyalkanoate synthesis regulator phasin
VSTPLWRLGFDLVERPIAAFSETWVQSDVFMDAAALGFKAQRRMTKQTEKALDAWLGAWGLATRRDVNALVNQVASLERQLRELAARDG